MIDATAMLAKLEAIRNKLYAIECDIEYVNGMVLGLEREINEEAETAGNPTAGIPDEAAPDA